jgi:hypothetical protein
LLVAGHWWDFIIHLGDHEISVMVSRLQIMRRPEDEKEKNERPENPGWTNKWNRTDGAFAWLD